MDTVILPDPLTRIGMLQHVMQPDKLAYYIFKHALNMLTYRELALADVDTPIVVVAPDRSTFEEALMYGLQSMSDADVMVHCSKLFDRTFSSRQELHEFITAFTTPAELAAQVKEPDRLLFDTDWSEPLAEQISKYLDEGQSEFSVPFRSWPAGELVERTIESRFMQSGDILLKSDQLGGTPLVDAPTSWQWLLWKYEYGREANAPSPEDANTTTNIVISNALQSQASNSLTLINKVTTAALIDLRQKHALQEMREIIRHGILQVDSATPETVAHVSTAIVANIDEAMRQHQIEITRYAKSGRRFFGHDLPILLGAAAVIIAAPVSGNTTLEILASLLGLAGVVPNPKDTAVLGKSLWKEHKRLQRSPAAILFRHTSN